MRRSSTAHSTAWRTRDGFNTSCTLSGNWSLPCSVPCPGVLHGKDGRPTPLELHYINDSRAARGQRSPLGGRVYVAPRVNAQRGRECHMVGDSGDVVARGNRVAPALSQEHRGKGVSADLGALCQIRVLEGHRREGQRPALGHVWSSSSMPSCCSASILQEVDVSGANLGVQPLAPPDLCIDPSAAHCLRALAVDSALPPILEGFRIHMSHISPPPPAMGHMCHQMGDMLADPSPCS